MKINSGIKKYISAILIFVLCLSAASCGVREEMTASPKDTVFTFDGENISLGEVYLYANTVREDYEATYGSDVWNIDVSIARDNSANMEDVTRKDIIEDIVHVKLLASKANEYKCALTQEEESEVASQTDAFYRMLTDEQIKSMALDYDMIHKVMQENAIAKKVYSLIIDDAEIEVSDEDARETTFYDLYFECYTVASNGDVTKLSDDEREAQYERALQAYNTLINPIELTVIALRISFLLDSSLPLYISFTSSNLYFHPSFPQHFLALLKSKSKNSKYFINSLLSCL